MEIKKNAEYCCKLCNFVCCKKSNYEIHCQTKKHNGNKKEKMEIKKNACKCGKIYTTTSGLWKHSKMCIFEDKKYMATDEKETKSSLNEIHEIKEIMKYLMKENSEMKHIMVEQQNMMMTQNISTQNMIMKVIENGTHNTTNNTINNNFNLQFFLNETCKNALNIDDFVSSIKVSLTELENTGRRGYIEGISTIIINELNKLSHCDRPIHCSDNKRETMYIKNENQWFKETEEKPILKKAIKIIANENIKQINTWRQQNPDCTEADSNKNNLYLQIVSNSMSGSTKEESDKNYEKIISNIAKQVIIDK